MLLTYAKNSIQGQITYNIRNKINEISDGVRNANLAVKLANETYLIEMH